MLLKRQRNYIFDNVVLLPFAVVYLEKGMYVKLVCVYKHKTASWSKCLN